MKQKNWNLYNNLDELKKEPLVVNKITGYVYIVQYGSYVKIGKTINPISRISAINGIAINYAGESVTKILLSINHVNYSENELILHEYFKDKRLNKGELFKFNLMEIINALPELKMIPSKIQYKDVKVLFRNKVLDRYLMHLEIESMEYYDNCINAVINVLNSEYLKVLEDVIGKRITLNFEEELNDRDFVKSILIANAIDVLMKHGHSLEYIENEILSNSNNFENNTTLVMSNREKYQ